MFMNGLCFSTFSSIIQKRSEIDSKEIQNHVASGYTNPIRLSNFICFSLTFPARESENMANTPKLISFGREYIDPRGRCAVLQKYKWKRTSAAPASTSGVARRWAVRCGRFQWGHVIARTRGRPPPRRATPRRFLAARRAFARGRSKRDPLYLLARASAHSHGRPLYHFRYRAARLTVHRSRRLLNPTLFARCITYFVIAHFVPR